MKRIVCIVVNMFILCTLFAQTKTLEGTWMLNKCEIRQDSAGVLSTIDYGPGDGNIPRWYIFTELTFSEGKYCSLLLNHDPIKGKYSLTDDDLLTLDYILMSVEYHYVLKNDTMLVLTRRHYLYNEQNPEKGWLDIELSYSKK